MAGRIQKKRFDIAQLTGSFQRSCVKHQRRSDDSEEKQRWSNDCGKKACRQNRGWTRSHQEPQGRQEDHENVRTTFPVACAAALGAAAPSPPSLIEKIDFRTQHPTDMNRPLSLALLAGGILLIIFGVNASNSFGSDLSRFFTGSPTDKAMWMLVGGAVAAVVGLVGLTRGSK